MPDSVAAWITGALLQRRAAPRERQPAARGHPDKSAQAATDILFLMSGTRHLGMITDTIRPHPPPTTGVCNFAGWGGGWGGYRDRRMVQRVFPDGWPCTCPLPSEYLLPNSPVLVDGNGNLLNGEIVVDGAPLDPSDYTVYDQRPLVRNVPATGGNWMWPCCLLLSFDTSQLGTWSVTYQHGVLPPQ